MAAHGDTHVGFREHDDAELARWAAKQRKDCKSGDLAPDRWHSLPFQAEKIGVACCALFAHDHRVHSSTIGV